MATAVTRGRPRKYDWDKWADGQTWVATRGIDFTVSPHQFQVSVHGHARYWGKVARTSTVGGSVIFSIREVVLCVVSARAGTA